MNDIENLLRRYQPAGPPPDLRERVAAIRVRRATVREWLPAIAAAAAVVILYSMTTVLQSQLADRGAISDDPRERVIQELATGIGGDASARELATWLVDLQERASLVTGSDSAPTGPEAVIRD